MKAFSGNREFFHITGIATVSGFAQNWHPSARTVIGSSVPFWRIDDFEFPVTAGPNNASGSQAVLTLLKPQTFSVDLSSIGKGQSFQIRIKANAHAHNRLGGPPSERPTSAGAYINFESPSGGAGSLFLTTGLAQADVPLDDPDPPPIPFPPLPCGSNPGAGVLQFSAATYTTPERDSSADRYRDSHGRQQRTGECHLYDDRRYGCSRQRLRARERHRLLRRRRLGAARRRDPDRRGFGRRTRRDS